MPAETPDAQSSPSLDLETRRRRLKFRAWHRGIKELDLLFGSYIDRHASRLDHADCAWFEALFEENDQEVFAWLMGREPIPARYDTPHFRAVTAQDGQNLRAR